jgi:hypothetical protein
MLDCLGLSVLYEGVVTQGSDFTFGVASVCVALHFAPSHTQGCVAVDNITPRCVGVSPCVSCMAVGVWVWVFVGCGDDCPCWTRECVVPTLVRACSWWLPQLETTNGPFSPTPLQCAVRVPVFAHLRELL